MGRVWQREVREGGEGHGRGVAEGHGRGVAGGGEGHGRGVAEGGGERGVWQR